MMTNQIIPQIEEVTKDYKCFTVRLHFNGDNELLYIEVYDNDRRFFCYDVLEQEVLFYQTYPSYQNLRILNIILQRVDSKFKARIVADRIIIETPSTNTILKKRRISRLVSSKGYFLNPFALRAINYQLTEFMATRIEEGF